MAAPLLRYALLVPVALLVSVLAYPAAPLAQVAILHTVDRTSASTIQIESYKPEFDPNNYTEPWLLEPYVMYDQLRVRYEAVTEELPDLGLSLRYDYVPERALAAAPRSVPLVVMLHGNNNDPRIQGESSGWVEVAAEHTLILTSIEWQGRKAQGNAARCRCCPAVETTSIS